MDGLGDENDIDIFGDESNGNSSKEPFDYSIGEFISQEQRVSLNLAPKLLDPTSKSSSYTRLNLDKIGTPLLPNLSRNAIVSEIAAEGLSLPIDTSEKATGDITLPSIDLQGALSSLQPRCWLSSTAIELVLSLCPSKSFRVFDPLAYDIGKPEIKNIKPIPNDV